MQKGDKYMLGDFSHEPNWNPGLGPHVNHVWTLDSNPYPITPTENDVFAHCDPCHSFIYSVNTTWFVPGPPKPTATAPPATTGFKVGDRVRIKAGPLIPQSSSATVQASAGYARNMTGDLGILQRFSVTFQAWELKLDIHYTHYGVMTDIIYVEDAWIELVNAGVASTITAQTPQPKFKAGDLVEIVAQDGSMPWHGDWNQHAGKRGRVAAVHSANMVEVESLDNAKLHFMAGEAQFRLVADVDSREFDGFCNPCGGLRRHRIGCPTKKGVKA